MARQDDMARYKTLESSSGNLPIEDMTPTPLTTADAAPETGTTTATGRWVRNPGRPGAVHIELSDTTTPSATVVVEYSNTQTAKGPVAEDPISLTAAGQGKGLTLLNGYIWVRVRVTAIAGVNASVTATLGSGV